MKTNQTEQGQATALYEYTLRDRAQIVQTVIAEGLEQAIVKFGNDLKLGFCFYGCATVEDSRHVYGVTWKPVRAVNLIAGYEAVEKAMRAVQARINGEWDQPDLVAFGPLLPDTTSDCLRIADAALAALAKMKGGQS